VCEWILKQDRSRWTNVYLTFSKKILGGEGGERDRHVGKEEIVFR
jgi:hypothetical protein